MLLTQKIQSNYSSLLICFFVLSFLLSTLSAIACPAVVIKFVPTSAAVFKSPLPIFMFLPKFHAILPNAPKVPPAKPFPTTLSASRSFDLSLS